MIKKLTLIFAVLLLSACSSNMGGVRTVWNRPYDVPEEAPPEYKLGWEHGCKTGLSIYGNSFYKTFYKYTQDPKMVSNTTYLNAWEDSLHYCRSYANRYLSGDNFTQPPNGDQTPVIPTNHIATNPYDYRDDRAVTSGFGMLDNFGWPAYEGLNSPGWGDTGWGASVDESKYPRSIFD